MNLFRKICALFRREKHDAEMRAEMTAHLDAQTERNLAAGMSANDARAAARRQFGGVAQIQERAREVRRLGWWEAFWSDMKFAVRLPAHAPGFTAVAVLTLALGIGATITIFSVVHGVLLKPLAYREPERLVALLHDGRFPVSPADFLDWRAQSRSFERIAAGEVWSATLPGPERVEVISAIRFGEDLFEVFGVDPLFGRTFASSDFEPGAARVLVISHATWQRHFGSDAEILGRTLTLSGDTFTVIGVMPPTFRFAPFWAAQAEMAAPLDLSRRATARDSNSLRVFARLKRDVSRKQAQSEMDAICRQLEQAYPQTNTGRSVRVDALLDKTVGDIRGSLRLLMGAVTFVLLIACANVANLLLARSSMRRKEMAVRSALGASPGRLLRHLFAESLLLAGIGSAFGLLLSYIAVGAIRTWLAGGTIARRIAMPRVDEIAVDSTILIFAVGLAVLTALVFGLAPALQSTRLAQQDALQDGGRGITSGRHGQRRRSMLIVGEIALSLVLVTGAGLMLRSFHRLTRIDPGFEPHQTLSLLVSLHGQPETTGERRELFYQECLREISVLPGVVSASAVNHLPLAGELWSSGFAVEGRPRPPAGQRLGVVYRVCRAGYFSTMGIALERGRDFGPQDTSDSPHVVIINEQLARTWWPGADPIGRRITLDDLSGNPHWLTIVGVVGDVRQNRWTDPPHAEVYAPFAQSAFFSDASVHHSAMTLVIRAAVDPLGLLDPVRNVIRTINRKAAIAKVATLDRVVADALWQPRFNLLLTVLFATCAVLLAAVGLYGVMAYAVSARRRELGIRIAVGARPRDVFRLTLGQGLRLASLGVALGLTGALALSSMLASLLYEVTPIDPLTYAAVTLLLFAVVILACWVPARRAAKIDPMVALRAE